MGEVNQVPSDLTLTIGGDKSSKPTDDMKYMWDITGTDPKTQVMRPYFKVFSTDNRPFDKATANAVNQVYLETGSAPPGYTVLPTDSTTAQLRAAFERYIATPARAAGERVANAPAMPTMEGGALGSVGTAVVNAVPTIANALSSAAKTVAVQPALTSMQTPEGAGALAGTAAAGMLTGGLTTVPAIAATALSSGLGYQAMNMLFGSGQPLGSAVGEAALAGFSRGVGGFLGWATGGSMAGRMQERTYGRLMDMVSKEYPHLKNDPQLLSYAFEKNGPLLKKATDILIDGYKQTAGTALKQLENDFTTALPQRFTSAQSKTYNGLLTSLKRASEDYVESQYKGPEAMKKVIDKMHMVYDKLDTFISTEFPNDPAFKLLGTNAITTYNNALSEIGSKASVVSRVQRYAGDGGWSDEAFRKSISAHFREKPSDLAQQATAIAQKGQLHSAKEIPIRVPHTPFGVNVGVGKVSPGVYNDPGLNVNLPIVGGTVATQNAMEDFVGAK
jgi:hypothetical protein